MTKKSVFNPSAINGNLSNKISTIESKDEFNFRYINIDLIEKSEFNDYAMDQIEELAENIKQIGLQQNLVVRPKSNGKYELLTGHRRLEALKLNGETKAPCKIEENLSDLKARYSLHSTNQLIRKEDEMSKAKHIKEMKELLREMKAQGEGIKGRIDEIVAKDMGMSAMQVQRYDKLNKLIPELQEMLTNKEITMSKATHFAGMDKEDQLAVLELLRENVNISREEAQKLKVELNNKDKTIEQIKNQYDEKVNKLEEENQKLLNDIQDKNSEMLKINNEIAITKEKIKVEAEKEAENKSSEQIFNLKNKLNKLLNNKSDLEKELNTLKEQTSNKEQQDKKKTDNMEKNTEIKFALRELNKVTTTVIAIMAKYKRDNEITLNEENIKSLESLKADKLKILSQLLNDYK